MSWSSPRIDFSKEVFFPGECVTGKVCIFSKKGWSARKIDISFFGKTITSWRIDGNRRNLPVDNVSHKQAEDVFLEMKHVAWTSDGTNNVPAGEYEWDFSFQLPEQCLPSFEGSFGFIRYFIRVHIDIPNWLDTNVESAITISPIVDLNSILSLSEPFELLVERPNYKFSCIPLLGNNGDIVYKIQSPKSGYVAGEDVYINGTIENRSSKTLVLINAALKRRITYRKDLSNSIFKFRRDNSSPPDSFNSRKEEMIIAEISENSEIEPGMTKPFRFTFTVPQVVSTIQNCQFISVEYFITVSADHSYCRSAEIPNFKLFVGNIPFKDPGTRELRPRKFVKMESAKCWSTLLRPKFRYQIPYYGDRKEQTEENMYFPFFQTSRV